MKDPVMVDDFYPEKGKTINLSGFTNIEKSITETEFNFLLKEKKHEVYTKQGLTSFLSNLSKNLDTLEKAEGSETSQKDILEKAKNEISSLKVIPVVNKNGALTRYYVREKSNDEIQKSIDSVMYNQTFKTKKKGKDIKEKVATLRSQIADKVQDTNDKIDELEETIDAKPTEPMSSWYTEGLPEGVKIPKLFHYSATYFNNNTPAVNGYSEESKSTIGGATSAEDAKMRCEYNELVYCIARCLKDLKKIDVFIDSLEENKEYELSVDDLVSLGF